MSLLNETLLISALMLVLSFLPFTSSKVRSYSKLFFLIGTGALTGICFFDLVPDVLEMGGNSSLLLVGGVCILYSLLHIFHLELHEHHHHDPAHGHSDTKQGAWVFLAAMIAHCVASGILLVVSENLQNGIARNVFFALLAHKGYEALTVSSVLIDRQKSKLKALLSVGVYAVSLPFGVGVTILFKGLLTQHVALVATSLALGSLLGCLMFDFLIPSFHHVKNRKIELAWIAAGLLATQFVMRSI